MPYSHLLNFLCHYHRHDIISCLQSLQQFIHVEWTISDCRNLFSRPEYLKLSYYAWNSSGLFDESHPVKRAFESAVILDDYNETSEASMLFSRIWYY